METENEQLYNMKLHEELTIDSIYYTKVLRVPGGWIYSTYLNNGEAVSVFVPFNSEFYKTIPKPTPTTKV